MAEQYVEPVKTAELAVLHEHRFGEPGGRCRCGATEGDVTGG